MSSDDDPIVEIPIEDAIDLHSFSPADVVSVVDEYLHAAREAGFREVRLIHGRGKGVQRAAVQSMLRGHPLAESFFDAPEGRGGWGATIVRLRASTEA
jgi:DNA-nicking Smr family endonuclease